LRRTRSRKRGSQARRHRQRAGRARRAASRLRSGADPPRKTLRTHRPDRAAPARVAAIPPERTRAAGPAALSHLGRHEESAQPCSGRQRLPAAPRARCTRLRQRASHGEPPWLPPVRKNRSMKFDPSLAALRTAFQRFHWSSSMQKKILLAPVASLLAIAIAGPALAADGESTVITGKMF